MPDKLGSVRDVVSTSGSVLDHVVYDSFGKIVTETNAGNGDQFKFAGMQIDSTTAQYYDHARWYGSGIGRFLSLDPTGFAAGDRNLYRYVENAPTNAIDPSGLDGGATITIAAGAGMATGVGLSAATIAINLTAVGVILVEGAILGTLYGEWMAAGVALAEAQQESMRLDMELMRVKMLAAAAVMIAYAQSTIFNLGEYRQARIDWIRDYIREWDESGVTIPKGMPPHKTPEDWLEELMKELRKLTGGGDFPTSGPPSNTPPAAA